VILDRTAYDRIRVADERRALRTLDATESLAIGVALWTAGVAAGFPITPEPRGQNVARQLRVRSDRLAAAWAAFER
jgi:hypothetical protein